jgi:excinuclease UvrABC nuclease subunit
VLVDGGSTQLNAARQTIRAAGFNLPVIAVVKDKHHRPERFLGEALFAQRYQNELLALNQEAHRFAVKYHRQLRDRVLQ